MKIKPEHYAHIKSVMATKADMIARHRQFIVDENKSKNVEMRLRWDILWATTQSKWICDNLYLYMDDTHIDTALRNIMKEIEI